MERATKDKTHGSSYISALADEARNEANATEKRLKLKDTTGPDADVCKMYYLLDNIKKGGCYLGTFEISALERVLTKEASSMGDVEDGEVVSIVVWTLADLKRLGGLRLHPSTAKDRRRRKLENC